MRIWIPYDLRHLAQDFMYALNWVSLIPKLCLYVEYAYTYEQGETTSIIMECKLWGKKEASVEFEVDLDMDTSCRGE